MPSDRQIPPKRRTPSLSRTTSFPVSIDGRAAPGIAIMLKEQEDAELVDPEILVDMIRTSSGTPFAVTVTGPGRYSGVTRPESAS
jgi:hypothetical protein